MFGLTTILKKSKAVFKISFNFNVAFLMHAKEGMYLRAERRLNSI
jgi:hypothetical protein